MNDFNTGMILVLSGPAGSGKGTVVNILCSKRKDTALSVSATTRQPRPGEKNGVHYHFLDRDTFEEKLRRGDVLEHTEYCGNYYGTLKSAVEGEVEKGRVVILEIEVEGAMQIKEKYPDAVTVMLIPPDPETLERRLRGRGTEDDATIIKRLTRAKSEAALASNYDYVVINHDNMAEESADLLDRIIDAELHRSAKADTVIKKFI